jgi:parvulin-like peptidyl-prolyl isomerase
VREKLSEKVVADMGKPALQRQVLEIFLPEPNESDVGPETGVKVRWIVFAPGDSMADARDTPADDPKWAKAKADAEAMHARIKADPEKFDELARTSSDEPTGRGNGGKQRWIYPSSPIDQPVKNAVLVTGLQPRQLLDPVKGDLGWYVIEFMRPAGDGETEWLESLKTELTDNASFRQAARDNSEAEEAADGGDIGWIARGQLVDELDAAIFGTAVGSNSDVITIAGEGDYLLRILKEETRTPTEEQLDIFEQTGFQYWYTRQKEDADIDYNLGSSPAV